MAVNDDVKAATGTDSISQFVDAGGVIREDDNVPSIDDDESNDYVPIEELDLNI